MSKGIVDRALVVRDAVVARLEKLRSVALLLARLAVGLVFLSTGWGKVHDLAKVTEFFTSLHIPMPGLNAVVVGYSELLCGAALVLGLLTRLATIPLIVSMTVAILTAKRADIHGLFDFFGQEETTYLIVLMMIAILGPGDISIDHTLVTKPAASRPRATGVRREA
jgi:putative oxidoreductase